MTLTPKQIQLTRDLLSLCNKYGVTMVSPHGSIIIGSETMGRIEVSSANDGRVHIMNPEPKKAGMIVDALGEHQIGDNT